MPCRQGKELTVSMEKPVYLSELSCLEDKFLSLENEVTSFTIYSPRTHFYICDYNKYVTMLCN